MKKNFLATLISLGICVGIFLVILVVALFVPRNMLLRVAINSGWILSGIVIGMAVSPIKKLLTKISSLSSSEKEDEEDEDEEESFW